MKLKICLLTLSLLTIFIWSCSESSAPNIGKDPVIDDVTLNYSIDNKTLFFSVTTDDPQGYEDVETVVYWMYYAETDSSEEVEYEKGVLLDDGTNGDITAEDKIFAKKYENINEGQYRIIAEAFDMDDNVSEVVYDTCWAKKNTAPIIYFHDVPSSYEKGDYIKFEIKVTDANSLDDIKSVNMLLEQPDGEMFKYNGSIYTFELTDDGEEGYYDDDEKGDGIYTIDFQTNKFNKQQGIWKFYFFAYDKSNEISNELTQSVSNPGVTITYPDSGSFDVSTAMTIEWEYALVDTVSIEYTTDADETNPEYIHIADVASYLLEYEWTIPDIESAYCKIRISDKELSSRYDVSDEYFEVKK